MTSNLHSVKTKHIVILAFVLVCISFMLSFVSTPTQAGTVCNVTGICGYVYNGTNGYLKVKNLGDGSCISIPPSGNSRTYVQDADSFGGVGGYPVDVYSLSYSTGSSYITTMNNGEFYKISDSQTASCNGPSNGRLTCYVTGWGAYNDVRDGSCS